MVSELNNLQRAGDFFIESAVITTSQGIKLNILPQIMHLEINENIQLNSVSGNVLLSDTIDIASIGPIFGQEYMSLRIHTAGVQESALSVDFTEELFSDTDKMNSVTLLEKLLMLGISDQRLFFFFFLTFFNTSMLFL